MTARFSLRVEDVIERAYSLRSRDFDSPNAGIVHSPISDSVVGVRLAPRQPDLNHSHEAAVGMIENVTVKHPRAGAIVIADDQLERLLERNVDRVFPCERSDRLPLLVEHLEEEAVQMKWVRPLRLV